MPTIETIRRITVQQVSEGGAAVRADLLATADAQKKVGDAASSAAVTSEVASRRQLSAAGAFDRVRASVDGAYRSQQILERQTRILDRALAQGATDAATYATTLGLLQARYGTVAAAAQRSARDIQSAWRGLGEQGSKALENIEAGRRLGSLGGSGAPTAANENRRLRADQVQNLAFQASDIVSSLGSGSNLSTVAFQQGPQIAQVFGGPGGASIKGAFTQAGEAASGLATRIGLVGGAIGVVTTAVLAGVAAFSSYASTQMALAQNLAGVGRASGATVGQINAIASASAAAGNVSVRTAREMAGEFAATGKIGTEMYGGLIGTVRDYAATTGQDVPSATKELAAAFADPARGADTLDKQLAVLNDTTRENIQRLAAQGDRLGAQKALLDAYRSGLTSATELTSGWARVTAAAGVVISDVWDRVGKAVDRVATGGDLETRIADLQKVLATPPTFLENFSSTRPALQAELDKLLEQQRKTQAAAAQAQQNQVSSRIGDLVRSLDPMGEQIKKISDQAKDIATNLSKLPFDEQGNARRTMEGLVAQARQLREDMQAGGAAYADALRSAQFQQRTIGFTPQGLSAAQINENAANKEREVARQGGNATDMNARLQSIEMERVTLLQNLERATTLESNQIGGAFSRMSTTVQQQVLSAAQQFGRIPANIIAGIADKESNGNPNIGFTKVLNKDGTPSTTAYGLGQITAGTARDAIRGGYLPQGYDRTNPDTMAAGIAGVLSMKLDQAGGDLNKAIQNYYGSKNPAANQAYAADVLRRAGQMGDPSTGAQIRDQDQYTRALRDQQQQLQNVTQNYGKNGLALEAAAEANRRYNAQLDAGVPANEALANSIRGLATQAATAAQQTKLVQFASDTGFEREQLGRDRYDQAAYSRARSTVGDTTSPGAQAVIEQSRSNQYLSDARTTLTDAASGFATALSHGENAAKAFGNALSRISDKLLSGLVDSLVGSLFKSGGGGLGSLFGFADGGYTGDGAKYQPAGIVHAGEYVMPANVVRQYGKGFFDGISGLRGYADGGFVAMPQISAPVPPVPTAPASAQAGPGQIAIAIDARGAQGNAEVQAAIERGVSAGMSQVQSHIERNINGIVANGSRRFRKAA